MFSVLLHLVLFWEDSTKSINSIMFHEYKNSVTARSGIEEGRNCGNFFFFFVGPSERHLLYFILFF